MRPLTDLHDPKSISLGYLDLLQKCDDIFNSYTFSFNQATKVEEMTRSQSKFRIWFQQHAGRITASRFREILHTDYTQPSISLIKSICYPVMHQLMPKACQYGCEHEEQARVKYFDDHSKIHNSLIVINCGLVLHPLYPFFGVSPDGIVNCSCCSSGVLEIKCPYRCKDKSLNELVEERNFCLENVDGSLSLKRNYAYYYQIQLQMKLCEVGYCDFVVWGDESVFYERILIDTEFIDNAIEEAQPFIKLALLPELVGKWFSRHTVATSITLTDQAPSSSNDNPPTTSSSNDNPPTTSSSNDNPPTTSSNNDSPPTTSSSNDSPPITSTSNDSPPITSTSNDSPPITSTSNDSLPTTSSSNDNPPTTSLSIDSPPTTSSSDNTCTTTPGTFDTCDSNEVWCFCKQGESYGDMIGCDNPQCTIQWFHLSCLKLEQHQIPKGKWYCPLCHQNKKTKK